MWVLSTPSYGLSESAGSFPPLYRRSVDAHWYPTAYADAVYHKIEDVEDLDNAAFLPEEQHAAEEAAQAAKAKAAKRRERQKAKKGPSS